MSKRSFSYPFSIDAPLNCLLQATAIAAFAVVLLIFAFLIAESWPALSWQAIPRFFDDPSWHPSEGRYNLAPMLLGTLLASVGALLLAVPLGIGVALFGHCYVPNWTTPLVGCLIELLAGIPSVVYGLWGLTSLVPLINRWHPPGTSLLAGILVLALMILPTIALTAGGALAAVPTAQLQSAAALGLSRWGTIRSVMLPTARIGIATGIMLAAGRAAGETMAVIMICGNVVRTPTSLFDPIRTLTANIALEMAYALGQHRAVLFVSGLALMAMALLCVALAELMARGQNHVQYGRC